MRAGAQGKSKPNLTMKSRPNTAENRRPQRPNEKKIGELDLAGDPGRGSLVEINSPGHYGYMINDYVPERSRNLLIIKGSRKIKPQLVSPN